MDNVGDGTGVRTAVVLDEHPLWLQALEQLLDRVGLRVVGKATAAERAVELVGSERPDMLLAGVELDGAGEPLQWLRRAQDSHPAMKAIVLSGTDNPQHIAAAFDAGAVAYCVKTAVPDDLASAIRQAFDHSIYYANGVSTRSAPQPASNGTDDSPDLTRRESEILQLVAEGHSNSQLAKMLWVTEQTVKFHLSNIYRKLDVANRTEASRWAQLHGLLSATPQAAA